MSEFWFWFLRPFAEFLGGIAFFALLFFGYIAFLYVYYWFKKHKEKS